MESFRFWNLPFTEPFDTFLAELRNKAETCQFQDKERMIRDKTVFSLPDRVQQILLRETDLQLTKAVDICRMAELERYNPINEFEFCKHTESKKYR